MSRYRVFNATTGQPIADVDYIAQAVGIVNDEAWKRGVIASILDTHSDMVLN